jgi:hypothetical protein
MAMPAFAADSNYRRQVEVEFEEIPDATRYEVKVTRLKDGGQTGKPIFFKTRKPVWNAEIAPGLYLLQLRSFDDRDVPGDWSDPFEYWVKIPAPKPVSPVAGIQVKSKGDDEAEVVLKWEEVPGAEKYRIEIMSEDESVRKELFSGSPSVSVELPVAKLYRWRVFSRLKEDVDGESPENTADFVLLGAPLDKPDIEEPITKVVQEIRWNEVEFARKYVYTYAFETPDGKWRSIGKAVETAEPKAAFDLSQPTGRYRISVQAQADKRQHSKINKVEFDVMGGLREPAAIEAAVLKESLIKPTNFYAIASYLITQMTYSAKLYDLNTGSAFDALSGTGRIGLGYQKPVSPWGYFGIIDMGGINIANKNFTFASMELHSTYKLNWSGRGQFLAGAGLFYKELPILRGSSSTGFEGVGKVPLIGPHAGAQYWLPLNVKLGVQFNARLYYGMLGSPDIGGKVEPSLSYQYGVLGSYRLNQQMMGYAGYAYRIDHADFTATSGAQAGQTNQVEMQGHFLNLVLDYSF